MIKRTSIAAFALVSLGLLGACQSSGEPSTSPGSDGHEKVEVHGSEPLKNNHGEKWIVNEEMKPYVQQGEQTVQTYIQENQTDYQSLAKNLKEQNDLLIQHCTMKGESHEELHKWLHPHMKMVDGLAKAKDEDDAMKRAHEIHYSYQTYHEYFQ